MRKRERHLIRDLFLFPRSSLVVPTKKDRARLETILGRTKSSKAAAGKIPVAAIRAAVVRTIRAVVKAVVVRAIPAAAAGKAVRTRVVALVGRVGAKAAAVETAIPAKAC